MRLRVAKKIIKNQDSLVYAEHQIAKAKTVVGRVERRTEKSK